MPPPAAVSGTDCPCVLLMAACCTSHAAPCPPMHPHQDSWMQYIEVLRRCKMSSRLREARQAMQAAFPLTESLWWVLGGGLAEGCMRPALRACAQQQ